MRKIDAEARTIRLIDSMFPADRCRLSRPFESDAEVVLVDDKQLLFTMDEFSAEDMLREDDPYSLGWNVAVGGISDILACAGKPCLYGHAMAVSKAWDEHYIQKFSQGVADVLAQAGTAFMGGDFGKAAQWRYTAAVIGSPGRYPLGRKGAQVGDSIYISGRIGLGNVEAGLKLYADDGRLRLLAGMIRNRFPLRVQAAAFIGPYARCCIDTSDGVFNALNTLADINGAGYEVADLPYIDAGVLGAAALSLPKELLFLGEAGEYELLFTVQPADEGLFLSRASQEGLAFFRIGKITAATKRLCDGKRRVDLGGLVARARDFDQRQDYLAALVRYLKEQP